MSWTLATVAVLLVAYAAVSARLAAAGVSAAAAFTAAGLLVGPALGLVDLSVGSEEVKLLAEVTLTLVLFADASRISIRQLRREYAVPVRLLGLGLPLTIALGAGVGVLVLPGVGLAEALVLAVVLACTDAALGRAVVTDARVPSRIRQGLNVESGLNDGLCVPLFLLALGIAESAGSGAPGLGALVLEEIGYGLVGGVVAGAGGALLLRAGTRRHAVEPVWVEVLTAATALLAAGIAVGLGGSIFIAAFAAGLVFGTAGPELQGEGSRVLDAGGELFGAVTFVVFGAVVLGPALDEVTWPLLAYAVLSLTVVRMVPVALAMAGTGARPPTVAFLGWFGPRGLASIVFGVILLDDADLAAERTLLLAVVVTVALSVVLHGVTAGPATARYIAWYESHPRSAPPAMEAVPAAEHRWRGAAGPQPAGRRDAGSPSGPTPGGPTPSAGQP